MILNIEKGFTFFKSKYNQSLMDLFKPLYFILSLLGLFPYMIKYPTPDDPRVEPKSMILNATCASIMSIALFTFFGLNIKYYLLDKQTFFVININYIIEVVTLTASGIIGYIYTFKNRKAYVEILNDISTTWNDLGGTDVKKITKCFLYHVRFMILGWLCMLLIWYSILVFMLRNTEKMYTLTPNIVLTAVLGFYYVLILMVACVLEKIVQHMRKLGNEVENEVGEALGRLEIAYRKTIEVKREINRIFEVPLALMLVQVFHTTLRQAHGLYQALYQVKTGRIGVVIENLFILFPVSKMFAMTYTGTMLKKKAFKIGQYLHAIPVKGADAMLFMDIQHFSKLMDFFETDISIFGNFSLDSNLMFNMMATAVTYFVLVVQFDL